MKTPAKPRQTIPLRSRILRLLGVCFAPLLLVIVVQLFVMLSYSRQYSSVLHNVTTASAFNQDFKENIDLTMYYYVVGSQYSTGLPIPEVEAAQELARNLTTTTTDKNSRKAIDSVLDLSISLETKINQIAETENYDDRATQLEDNVYILTDLIQDYMYTYLYYEAAQLSRLQSDLAVQVEHTVVLLAGLAVVLLLALVLYAIRITKGITGPISALSKRVEAIGQGNLSPTEPVVARETEVQSLSAGVEKMVGQLNDLLEQRRQEQTSLRNAELALLQSQINPHFLYNTLDTIIWLIETEKYADAENMITSLSAFFRTSLSRGRDIITLDEEAQHIASYLAIQQFRYRDIMSYRLDIDPALSACTIPKLTLQPLVENALYHGIKLKRSPGVILVRGLRAENGDVLLLVKDDGVGISPERLAEMRASLDSKGDRIGFGLATVHERIRLLYGNEYGLTIESTPGVGTTVTVRIPCHMETEPPAIPAQKTEVTV